LTRTAGERNATAKTQGADFRGGATLANAGGCGRYRTADRWCV